MKLSKAYGEEGDTIVVPERTDTSMAWYIYEFVALAIPISACPCKCNRDMATRLDKISVEEGEDANILPSDMIPQRPLLGRIEK